MKMLNNNSCNSTVHITDQCIYTFREWGDVDTNGADGERVTERDQRGRGLGRHRPGHLSHGQHIALLHAVLLHQPEGRLACRHDAAEMEETERASPISPTRGESWWNV
jgi:hypothetical protein